MAVPSADNIVANAAILIDLPHHEIHLGLTWLSSYKTPEGADLADDATIDILVVIGDPKSIHICFEPAAGGNAEVQLFEQATYTAPGAELGVANMNRDVGTSPSVKVYLGPTLTAVFASLVNFLMPGGTKNFASGSIARSGTEWILRHGTSYVFRLTNRAGSAQPASITMQWYEEDPS